MDKMDNDKVKLVPDNLDLNSETMNNNQYKTFETPSTTPIPRSPLKYKIGESRRMIRNVIVLSVSFTFLFTAYSSMASLQSSINEVDGLGNYASSVVYASMVISALFVPTAFIRRATVKWTIFISMFGYTTFILAQFYPQFGTLLPAAAIVGLCAAPLWAAKCTYLTHLGKEYAGLTSQKSELVIGRFFGLFFMLLHTNTVFGNIISSTVLSSSLGYLSTNQTNSTRPPQSMTFDISLDRCGANFCPGTTVQGVATEKNKTKIYVLAGTYLAIALLAATVIGIFLDSLSRYGETPRKGTTRNLISATWRQMKTSYQILMIPLTIWVGLGSGFLNADFTAAYITCGWGVENVGYVLICYGLADSLSSFCYSHFVQILGRVSVFFLAAAINVGVIIGLLYWTPNPDEKSYFFIVATLWGIADSCWLCGINSYYGILFPNDTEAAFSNFRLWDGIGASISYFIANLICVDTKLYFLLTVLTLGMMGFSSIQIYEWRLRRRLT